MNLTNLISALISVESGGNDLAIGDGGRAIGPLQIHRCVVDDVNKRFRTHYRHIRMTNRTEAVEVFTRYVRIYATEKRLKRTPSVDDIANLWNLGPENSLRPRGTGYSKKVKRQLLLIDENKNKLRGRGFD